MGKENPKPQINIEKALGIKNALIPEQTQALPGRQEPRITAAEAALELRKLQEERLINELMQP